MDFTILSKRKILRKRKNDLTLKNGNFILQVDKKEGVTKWMQVMVKEKFMKY